jgi:hypothetical protein
MKYKLKRFLKIWSHISAYILGIMLIAWVCILVSDYNVYLSVVVFFIGLAGFLSAILAFEDV